MPQAKIASYNCQQSHERSTRFLAKSIEDGADAACSQESGTRLNLHSYITGAINFSSAEGYVDDACVVLTQTADRANLQKSLPIHAGSNKNRSALLIQLRSKLIVVNVHLTSGNERRARNELSQIVQYLKENHKGSPWVIIGDFNHDPTGDYNGVLVARGPKHNCGAYLDWAIAANVDSMTSDEYPRYFGADHGPWYVEVSF